MERLKSGMDYIMVVVDRFTKLGKFIPAHKNDDAVKTAQQYVDWIV